jgi:hypothetical protein
MTNRELSPGATLTAMINGYWLTQMIHVAARLGIADALALEPRSVAALAERTGAHPRSLYRLLRALAGSGIFRELSQGRFELTPLGNLLRSDVPGSLHAVALYSGDPRQHRYDSWGDLYQTVKSGEPAFRRLVGLSPFDYLATHPEPELGRTFDAAMESYTTECVQAVLSHYDFSEHHHVVDIGGGKGRLLAEILKRHEHVRGTLLDMPHVVDGARSLFEREGLGERALCVAGNFFEQVPSAGDLYVLKCIVHDWADDQAVAILQSCRRAMSAGSRLMLLEAVISEGNEPCPGKLMDMNMMVIHGGLERTRPELAALLSAAGFALTSVIKTGSSVDLVLARPT